MPGNVYLVMTKMDTFTNFDMFQSPTIFAFIFKFSETDEISYGFTQMGID
jgi:hypothetical protein